MLVNLPIKCVPRLMWLFSGICDVQGWLVGETESDHLGFSLPLSIAKLENWRGLAFIS